MRASTTFQRALLSLSHPISIAAIAVVLLNDHLLRHVWPSWFTGKIGDVDCRQAILTRQKIETPNVAES